MGTSPRVRAVCQCQDPPLQSLAFWGVGTPTPAHLLPVVAIPGLALLLTEADVSPLLLTQGTSTKYSPQRVGLTHTMEHEDVIQIVKK